jgi:zinc protease
MFPQIHRPAASRVACLAVAFALSAGVAPIGSAAPAAPAAKHAATTKHATASDKSRPAVALTDTLRLDPRIRTGTLPNGLRYLIRANHKPEARVALRLAVNAGATVESDDQRGLAHFAEHMNFNGSQHFKPEELVAYLQSIGLRFGADANAYTSFDETVYMLEVPTDRDTLLDRGVMALSDFAGRATMSDVEIDKERGVVLEEWRLGQGARERVSRQQYPKIFHGSRYADRIPIGLPEIIQKAPHDRLRAYYRDWYTPDRMTVIAVGDIDPGKMENLIRKHFGGLERPADSRPTPVFDIPPHSETLISIATDPEATRSSVTVMYKRPHKPSITVADYRRDLLIQLYSSMLNARFDEIAHRADPPYLGASGFLDDLGRTSDAWQLSASVKDGGIEAGLQGLLEEAARVRGHGFLPSELTRAKDRVRAYWERLYAEREKSESDNFADEYVRYALEAEPVPGIEAESAITTSLLGGITLDEVAALTPQLMHDDSRVVLAIAPAKANGAVPTEAGLRAVLDKGAALSPGAWVDATAGKALMAKLPEPGRIRSRRSVDEIGTTVLTLSNGVEVWLKPTTFKADEIQFSAYALGGHSLADSADIWTAWMTPSVIGDAGVGGFTGTEVQKLLAGRIARAGATYGPYTHGVFGSARPADLETALQLVYMTFTAPTRDPDGFAALKKRARAGIEDRANSPEAAFVDTITAVNTGNFYMDRTPTPQQIDSVQLDRVLAYHRRHFANAADFTFAFAGSFDVDSIAPLIARYLGALPSQGQPTTTFASRAPRYPAGTIGVQVHKGLEPKSSTRITFFTNGALIEELDMHRARACASILTDHLRQTLRELMGGTYGASSWFTNLAPLPGYATMNVAFGCDPARVDTMVAATLAEIRKLREAGPSTSDVQKDQEIERRELEVALQQNGVWTGSILTCLQLGIDPRRIAHRRERIDLLNVENLRDTYRKYFPLDRRTVISLLPAAAAGGESSVTPDRQQP